MLFFDCNKIKQLRQYEGLTKKGFAEKIGVTEVTVARWENGQRIPNVTYISTISNIFKVPIDYFFIKC